MDREWAQGVRSWMLAPHMGPVTERQWRDSTDLVLADGLRFDRIQRGMIPRRAEGILGLQRALGCSKIFTSAEDAIAAVPMLQAVVRPPPAALWSFRKAIWNAKAVADHQLKERIQLDIDFGKLAPLPDLTFVNM